MSLRSDRPKPRGGVTGSAKGIDTGSAALENEGGASYSAPPIVIGSTHDYVGVAIAVHVSGAGYTHAQARVGLVRYENCVRVRWVVDAVGAAEKDEDRALCIPIRGAYDHVV